MLIGPYGVPTHADRLLGYDRILFVAGGVGATFIVPLYRQLLSDLSPSRGSYRRTKVKFIWAVRSAVEAQWALPEDAEERNGFIDRSRVYVTGLDGSTSALANRKSFPRGEESQQAKSEELEGIELEDQEKLLGNEEEDDASLSLGTGDLMCRHGRPDLARLVHKVFSHGNSERVAVVVCGPKTLTRGLRKEVGRWVNRGRDVWIWEESFGW